MIGRLLFIAVAIVAVMFAVSNRGPATVDLWPLPYRLDLPLYFAVLGALVVGFFLGAMVTWFAGAKWRRRARTGKRRSASLEVKVRDAERAAAAVRTPALAEPAALAAGRRRAAVDDE